MCSSRTWFINFVSKLHLKKKASYGLCGYLCGVLHIIWSWYIVTTYRPFSILQFYYSLYAQNSRFKIQVRSMDSVSGVHRPPEGQRRNGVTRAQSQTGGGGPRSPSGRSITILCHVGFSILQAV